MTMIKTSLMASHAVTILLAVIVLSGAANKLWAQDLDEEVNLGQKSIGESQDGTVKAAIALSAALTMGAACLAAGFAVAKIGAAAMGAASEKPEIMGRAMLFVAIAEGIAIYGLIIAVFMLGKM